ncbi:MAG: MATE family efflux transporter [Gammaproteobacteria bacterium]|nr:MATE family efflux transporter [Gammaproteobacteria bacterium]
MFRAELRQLLQLALPLILTQLSQMGMGVADTIMAGRVSAADLAGVALGGNLFWPTVMFLSGIIMSITPSVSQLHGAGRQRESGEVVRQALWIAVVGGGVLVVGLRNVEALYHLIGVDPLAIPISVAYLQAMSWGVLPLLGYFAMRYLCEGMSWTLPAMLITGSALLLKIPLNYLFIYGGEVAGIEIPAMGGAGCGWSSALVMWYVLIAIVVVVVFSRMKIADLFGRFSTPDWQEIGRLIRLGLPIGATIFLEFSMFSVVTLLIGRLGVEAVAAHQIGTSVGGVTFMVPMALGMAASIRVGFNIGAGKVEAARRSGWVAINVALVFALLAALMVFFGREWIAGLYTKDLSVQLLAVDLLLFVVVFQFFDDAQVTALGALRGYKDTRTSMWIAMVSYWAVGLPVGVALGFGWLGIEQFTGVRGFWVGLTAGLGVAAVFLTARFRWLSLAEERIAVLAER